MPPGQLLEGGSAAPVDRFEEWLRDVPASTRRALRAAFYTLEASTIATRARPFSSLSLEDRMAVLAPLGDEPPLPALRMLLRALLTPLKFAHFDRPEMFAHVGCAYELERRERRAAALARRRSPTGATVAEDLTLECEVVVIGTGAGGAAAAYELASRGRAVLLLEEGDFHRRGSFRASPAQGPPGDVPRPGDDDRARQRRHPRVLRARGRRQHRHQLRHLLPHAGAHLRRAGASVSASRATSRPRASARTSSASRRCSR